MIAELRDLYQELILDHNRRPRNRRRIEGTVRTADGYNPLCGDRVRVFLKVDGDVIEDASFEGTGCAISTASASMMTECLKGKTICEAKELFQRFRSLVTGEIETEAEASALGKLVVFAGVREYPARVKCATLAWHTLGAALERRGDAVSTE